MTATAQAYGIRRATADDMPIIIFHRCAMFEDMGIRDRVALDAMNAAFADWVKSKIERGDYRGWFVIDDRCAVLAGVGLWLQENLPSPRDSSNRRGYVLNVYTVPEHRRRGYARRLMGAVMKYIREQGIRTVVLHASDAGRTLYESLGMRLTNEMRIVLPQGE
jgi:ribosomal protein S18 acetylase RimI-like enzyme